MAPKTVKPPRLGKKTARATRALEQETLEQPRPKKQRKTSKIAARGRLTSRRPPELIEEESPTALESNKEHQSTSTNRSPEQGTLEQLRPKKQRKTLKTAARSQLTSRQSIEEESPIVLESSEEGQPTPTSWEESSIICDMTIFGSSPKERMPQLTHPLFIGLQEPADTLNSSIMNATDDEYLQSHANPRNIDPGLLSLLPAPISIGLPLQSTHNTMNSTAPALPAKTLAPPAKTLVPPAKPRVR